MRALSCEQHQPTLPTGEVMFITRFLNPVAAAGSTFYELNLIFARTWKHFAFYPVAGIASEFLKGNAASQYLCL